ncbi:multiple epidermal growth factor domains protein 11, partial [Biomphalaria glabrata]
NEPAGRQWDVTFSGSETEYNGDTIKIVIDVVDGSSADVGLYRCSYTDAEAALHYSDSVYLRSNDTLENQIVNKNSVGENDMLVIVCDIQKFQPEDYPDFAYINALSAEWKPVGQDDFLEIAVFSPFGHDESTKYVTNIPAGRNWSVDYIGANNDFNRDSIKIVIVKEDADYRDAGMYRCNYKNYKNTFYSETQRLLVKPNKPRLNLDIVKHVNNFTVECEIRRFSQKSDFLGNHAGIERKLEGASQYSVIRLFSIYGNKTTESTMIAPPGRSWGGGSKYGDNINIYVEMRDVDCYDAGLYRCISIEDQLTVYSEPVQLKSQETFQQDSIKIVLSDGIRAASLELQEKTDFNVNCTFLGPTTLKSSWTFKERGILNMDHKYTIADLPTTKVLDTRNCLATLHTSQLTYQYESEKDEWTFVCSVFDDKGRLFKSAILPVTVQKKVTDNNNLSLPVTDNNKEGVKEKTTASSDLLSNYGPWSEWACGRNCKDTNMYRKRECDLNMACQGQKEESQPADCYTKGICPSDCYVGRWGVGCTSTCHNCLKDCDKFTGFCDRCKNGYFDPQLSCNSSKIQFLSNPVPTEGESVRFVCTAAVLDAVPKDTTCVNMVQVFYYNITLRNNSVLAVYQRTDTNNIFQLKDMNWLVTTSGINYTENDKCMNLFTATIALRTSNVQVKDSGSYICSILTSTEQWLYQGATLSVQPLSKTSSYEKTTQRAWFRSKATRTESPTLDVIKIILILVIRIYFIKRM